jgi:hypothetical protein
MNTLPSETSLLVNETAFFRREGNHIRRDYSSFSFIVEAMIAAGATSIAVPSYMLPIGAEDSLDPLLRKRVRRVDLDRSIAGLSEHIFEPIGADFEAEMDGGSVLGIGRLSHEQHDHLSYLYFRTYQLILGMREELIVDVPIMRMAEAANALLPVARSKEARARLSLLAGVLNSYRRDEKATLIVASGAATAHAAAFHQFLEDELYRDLAQQTHGLGIRGKIAESLTQIRRVAELLADKPPFRQIISLTTMGVNFATGTSLPDADGIKLLAASSDYYPPIVRTYETIRHAERNWINANDTPVK